MHMSVYTWYTRVLDLIVTICIGLKAVNSREEILVAKDLYILDSKRAITTFD